MHYLIHKVLFVHVTDIVMIGVYRVRWLVRKATTLFIRGEKKSGEPKRSLGWLQSWKCAKNCYDAALSNGLNHISVLK